MKKDPTLQGFRRVPISPKWGADLNRNPQPIYLRITMPI